MANSDSDCRYMVASNLLQQSPYTALRADFDTQKRHREAVPRPLRDTNSEFPGMAMKFLAPLAAFVETAYAT